MYPRGSLSRFQVVLGFKFSFVKIVSLLSVSRNFSLKCVQMTENLFVDDISDLSFGGI